MLEIFDEYVKQYDLHNEGIKAKYQHSYRVMKLSEKYAKMLNFSDEDIFIAKVIGLLHDYGRFPQYQKYQTFDDYNSIDHADYSVQKLFDEGEIKKFNISPQYYDIIKFAIQNHNKIKIAKTDDKRKLKHAKIIRDADKLDIIYLLGYLKRLNLNTSKEISAEVLKCFEKHKSVPRELCQKPNDRIVMMLAFAFDIYNDICLKELKDNYKYFYERLNNKEIFETIYLDLLKYIDERIDKNVR